MTPSKPLPKNCETARLECLASARHGYRLLEQALDLLNSADAIRLCAKAAFEFQKIENQMHSLRSLNQVIKDYLDEKVPTEESGG